MKSIAKKIILVSLKKKKLKKKQIFSICKLKNSFWKWNIKNQLEWFKVKVYKNDINNLLLIDDKIIGYTLLRKRKARFDNKSFNYYYLDSFLIDKRFRKKKLGEKLILFNNKIIRKLKKHAFLICPKEMVNFYLKYEWTISKKKSFKLIDHTPKWLNSKSKINALTYNLKKKNIKKISYQLN